MMKLKFYFKISLCSGGQLIYSLGISAEAGDDETQILFQDLVASGSLREGNTFTPSASPPKAGR
jgi:hypothetical protein